MGLKKNIIELTRCSEEEYRAKDKFPLIVVVDNVRSRHNIGALFRTCDAFLIREIVLGGISACPPDTEISKTALGAENTVKWHYVADSLREVRRLKSEGWKICCLEQAHESLMLQNFHRDKEEKIVLVVGNEVNGVSQDIIDIADCVLEIPQYGTKHSLNVSVSAGIALYHILFIS